MTGLHYLDLALARLDKPAMEEEMTFEDMEDWYRVLLGHDPAPASDAPEPQHKDGPRIREADFDPMRGIRPVWGAHD